MTKTHTFYSTFGYARALARVVREYPRLLPELEAAARRALALKPGRGGRAEVGWLEGQLL